MMVTFQAHGVTKYRKQLNKISRYPRKNEYPENPESVSKEEQIQFLKTPESISEEKQVRFLKNPNPIQYLRSQSESIERPGLKADVSDENTE